MSLTRHSGTARGAGLGIQNHNPASFCTARVYGFRAPRFARPRNDRRPALHPRGGARLLEMAVGARRRAHQEAIAVLQDALAVAGLDVRMAAYDVVLLAGLDHVRHVPEQFRMLVLARETQLLAEIAFAAQARSDALHLAEHRVEIRNPARVLDLQ